jgi:hypothetical protein
LHVWLGNGVITEDSPRDCAVVDFSVGIPHITTSSGLTWFLPNQYVPRDVMFVPLLFSTPTKLKCIDKF